MKLFKGHAVLPRVGREPTYAVRTYVVIAETWQKARTHIRDAEPFVEFVTVPREIPDVLMTDFASLTEGEFEDLRSACAWHENASWEGHESQGQVRLDGASPPEESR